MTLLGGSSSSLAILQLYSWPWGPPGPSGWKLQSWDDCASLIYMPTRPKPCVSGLCPCQHRATFGPRPRGLGSHDLSTTVPQPVPPSERSLSPTATFLLCSHCYEKLNSTMNTCVLSFRIQKFLTFCHICWLTLYIYTVPKPSEGKFQAPYTSACSPMWPQYYYTYGNSSISIIFSESQNELFKGSLTLLRCWSSFPGSPLPSDYGTNSLQLCTYFLSKAARSNRFLNFSPDIPSTFLLMDFHPGIPLPPIFSPWGFVHYVKLN